MIVDDEQLARTHLRLLLQEEADVEIVGEASNGEVAAQIFEDNNPDLVFLDISLRNESGFDILAKYLHQSAKIIFVTAFAEHAARAFDVHALDYLLKPVSSERLRESLKRFRNTRPSTPTTSTNHLIPLGTTNKFLSSDEILYIEAANQNSQVTTVGGQTIKVRQSLREWIHKLPSPPFVKLERSLIVNLSKVVSVSYATRSAQIKLDKLEAPIHLGNKAALRLRALLNNG